MTRQEHLHVIAMEECDEISHRISKAARFGMSEVQPHDNPDCLTNRARIRLELADLLGVLDLLGLFSVYNMDEPELIAAATRKQAKVEQFLLLSKQCGTLTEG